jgi:hypothetical protein
MYQHLDSLYGRRPTHDPVTREFNPTDEQLEPIRARLDKSLPDGPYIEDEELARILRTPLKTFRNRRSSQRDRIPYPIRLAGSRKPVHERGELIEWLAREELRAKFEARRRSH